MLIVANITGFRIDTDVTFSFDTGGAVPPPSGGATAIRAKFRAKSAKGFSAPVVGGYPTQVNIDDLERGDISSSGGNISSNYYLRFKSSAKYELPEGASSIRARVTLASSVSSYTPRFGIAYYDAEDNFLSLNYYFSNNAWSALPVNTAKVRYTISYTNGNGILPEHIEAMTIETM